MWPAPSRITQTKVSPSSFQSPTSRDIDLIVDTGEGLRRVEVKTTREKSGEVHLATDGGNRSWNGEVKALSAADCDLVFTVNLNTGAEREFLASELDGRKTVRVNHQVLDLGVAL